MKKILNYIVLGGLFLGLSGCQDDFIDLNLGPKGGGTIDPKITVGQTVINFKEGDGVLLFNLNLSGASGFSTKDVATSSSVVTTTR